MGVFALGPILEKTVGAGYMTGVPPGCSHNIDEAYLRVFKQASNDDPVPLKTILKHLSADYRRWFMSRRCWMLVIVGDDSRYVPTQKKAEQDKRTAYQKGVGYEENCIFKPAIVEHATEEKADESGAIAKTVSYEERPGGVVVPVS